MDQEMKITIRNMIIVGLISIGVIIAFSIPLGLFPALGNFLFPGNGVWTMPEDAKKYQVISSSEISADVTVYRDEWGIPHIYGHSEEDLTFALGYVQAQDRLFQMDMARRLTRGKLSEILGPDSLETDMFNLNKMMDYWTVQTWNEMKTSSDPTVQKLVDMMHSYSAGVNHYITNAKTLPLEFMFLNFEPELWTPVDSLCFIKYMSEMLTWGYNDFNTILTQDAIGQEAFLELYDMPSPYQIPITPDYGGFDDISLTSSSSPEPMNIDSVILELSKNFMNYIEEIPDEKARIETRKVLGSNNWVVNGSKTETGKPILCNDMHLSHSLPGIWYEAHIVDISLGSDFNLYGFFIAGVPYPIVGHNRFVGWGLTNTAYDVIDWYYYTGVNDTHYIYDKVITEYEYVDYSIKVLGEADHQFRIKLTVHGPVFDSLSDERIPDYLENKVIANQWIGQSITYEGLAIYLFAHSDNRADFNYASTFFSTPAQNIIYGDSAGNIGIRPTGKVPIRDDTNIPSWHLGNGTMLYNGTNGEGDWIDYVPFNDLPHSENPDQGYLVSANQIIAGPDYLQQYRLQNPLGVDEGFRARRLNNLMKNGDSFTVQDMKKIQLDAYTILGGNLTPYLLDVLDAIPSKTTQQQTVYDMMQNWDFLMHTESAEASIYYIWMKIFEEETFADELGQYAKVKYPSENVLEMLTKTNASSIWFDNSTSPAVETRDDIILIAINKALTALTEFYDSNDPTTWLWGSINYLEFPHLTGISAFSAGPYSVNGTGDTVNPTFVKRVWENGKIQKSYATGGASERMIIDFSDLNNTLSVIPSGESGISHSKHYTDQLELYLDGKYHVQYFSANTIAKFQEKWIESTLIIKAGAS
ncbi:MAG: penicillin acylase family protein [Candidatus Heimdallarchaeota archaeon]